MSEADTPLTDQATHFQRRERAILTGLHLPSEMELLDGLPFFRGRLEDDVREFASRLLGTAVPGKTWQDPGLIPILAALTVAPSAEILRDFRTVLGGEHGLYNEGLHRALLRATMYLAALDDLDSMYAVATENLVMATEELENQLEFLNKVFQSLHLLRLAASHRNFVSLSNVRAYPDRRDSSRFLPRERYLQVRVQRAVEALIDVEHRASMPTVRAGGDPGTEVESRNVPTTLVLRSIGSSQSEQGKRVATEFGRILNRPLPLLLLERATSEIGYQLSTQFPHARSVADGILSDLSVGSVLRIRPTILVGGVGIGKSSFASLVSDLIGTPKTMVPFGGLSDSSLSGTPRRWSTGEPSLPLRVISETGIANPVIILDEVDKPGTGHHNGHPHDALLSMLESSTSGTFLDPYVQSTIDVSHIIWIMTANSVSGIAPALRDRCRILKFPAPAPEHLAAYVRLLVPAILSFRGLHKSWMGSLDGVELASLDAWRDGSLRTLRKMLEAIVDDREMRLARQRN